MTKIVAIGDIMGKAGRRVLDELLPKVRAQFEPDFIVANGENAAGGKGLTKKVYKQLTQQMGIDCLTMGNHWHDKPEIYDYFPHTDNIVLPANMANVKNEHDGLRIITTKGGERIAVINLVGKAFMVGQNRCPFEAADKLMESVPDDVKIRLVDMHAEATSEKQGIGHYLTGRASLVYGTHSHVPSADTRVFEAKTGYITDIGMSGPYDSVIGVRKEAAILRMRTGERKKFEPATGDPWLCFVVANVDSASGQCESLERYIWKLSENS